MKATKYIFFNNKRDCCETPGLIPQKPFFHQCQLVFIKAFIFYRSPIVSMSRYLCLQNSVTQWFRYAELHVLDSTEHTLHISLHTQLLWCPFTDTRPLWFWRLWEHFSPKIDMSMQGNVKDHGRFSSLKDDHQGAQNTPKLHKKNQIVKIVCRKVPCMITMPNLTSNCKYLLRKP